MEDAPFDPKCQNVHLKITKEKEMSEFCFILFFFHKVLILLGIIMNNLSNWSAQTRHMRIV